MRWNKPTDLQLLLDYAREVAVACDELPADDDWDDEGSPAPNRELIVAAQKFLLAIAGHVYATTTDFRLPPPRISPGVNAGIDAHWDDGEERLLMSFRPGPKGAVVSFYGDNRTTKHSVEGSFADGYLPWDGFLYQWFAEWGQKRVV